MFGYVRPKKGELKVKEYELYRAVYCGLCRTMGRRYGHSFRLSLSYDFVFLALLHLDLTGEECAFEKKRCPAHPMKKRLMMKENDALRSSCDVAALMLYHDLRDKIADRDGAKSFLARLTLPFASRFRKKAIKKYGCGSLDTFMREKLDALSALEKDGCTEPDRVAGVSGELLGKCAEYGLTEETHKRIAAEIGLRIGRVIYLIDAVDDLDSDEEKRHYNPLIAENGSAREAKTKRLRLETALLLDLKRADDALSLSDGKDPGVRALLENAFRLGLPETADEIFKEKNYHD